MNSSRRIASHYVLLSDHLIKNSIVTFDAEGVVTDMEENVADLDTRAGVEFFDGILIPGTVNCHCHLEYSYVKGMIPPGGGLPEFIRSIVEIKYNGLTSREKMIDAASLWDDLMYREGVTAVGDVDNYDYTFAVKQKSGIYYHNFVELLDMDNETPLESFRNGWHMVEKSRSMGLQATIVPHANYTMCDELMQLAGGKLSTPDGQKADGIVSVHFKESIAMGGEEETRRTIGSIDPNRPALLIHCIYADEKDLEIAAGTLGQWTVVPCPCSNVYIENRLPDLQLFRRKGLHIALGTDSLSSNTQLSMVEEIKCVQKHCPEIPLEEVLTWATKNGAEALGIRQWAGTFEVGKRPGAVLLENIDLSNFRLTEATRGRRII